MDGSEDRFKSSINEERRRFLKSMGLWGFTLGTASMVGDLAEDAFGSFCSPMYGKPDFDEVVNTACGICMVQCGMKAYKKNGRVCYVAGNPADPFSRGHLCAKGKASLGFLNNPDRLLYPIKRTNPDNKDFGVNPGWVRITWEEAFSTIVDKMMENTDNGKHGERLAIFSHGNYGWVARLLGALGSPNLITHYDTCFSPFYVARKALIGDNCWCNLEGVKYMLSFGWDQLDRSKNHPSAQTTTAIANGAKVVCFNPYQGTLGALGTQWIPIKPGSDLAVALAMIQRILSQNRFDKEFVKNKTNFYEHEKAIRDHFKTFTPEWAEKISEVPAKTIITIADEFSDPKHWPALIPNHKRDGAGGPNYVNSYQMAHAIILLNALVGAIDREGGKATMAFTWNPGGQVACAQNPKPLKELIQEKGAIDGKHEYPLVRDLITDRGIFYNVAQRILDKDPYELKMAIFRRYGIQSFPNPKKMAKALSTLNYLVFVDSMPKDIMWFADLVLPEVMFLESDWISDRLYTTPGYQMVFAANKAQAPVGEQKGWGGMVFELGKRVDQKLGTKYFQTKEGEWIKDDKDAFLKPLGITFAELKQLPESMWKKEVPYTSKSEYKTPSHKIEMYGTLFEKHGYDPLPKWIEKSAQPNEEYPYYLLIRRLPGMKHSAPLTSNNPYILDAFPKPFAEINSATARKLGIAEGDRVELKSKNGSVQIIARISERIRPDCIMYLHNYGHILPELSLSQGDTGDGNLIPDRPKPKEKDKDWSASAWMSDVCVRIQKI